MLADYEDATTLLDKHIEVLQGEIERLNQLIVKKVAFVEFTWCSRY